MKISLLLTGNELMSGDTVDTNSSYIAQSLKDLDLIPYIKKVVGDDIALLVSSIQELAGVSDVLIINGGLGPTVDDLTSQALSEAIDSPIRQHPQALQELESWAALREFKLTTSNLKQADLPASCDIIENPNGSAVGFYCRYRECLIVCTPGVPSELKPMIENHILGLIRQHGDISATAKISRLRLFGFTESGLQDIINEVFPEWPAEVELGFRVQLPVIEVKIRSIGRQHEALNAIWTDKFSIHFSDYVIGRDSTRLSQALLAALVAKNQRVTIAESCTGGLIAAGLTSEAGSSAVFEAGFVVYSNRIKTSMLGVNKLTLERYGAVSEQVVREMAEGALRVSGADYSLAISGIAGPAGGSDEKPVGTVWIAWGRQGAIRAKRFFLPIPRIAFQRTAAAFAMDLLRRELLSLSTDVNYFSELKQ